MPDERDPGVLAEAERVWNTAHYMCMALSQHASDQKRRQRVLRALNFLVGFAIALLSALSIGSSFVTQTLLSVIALVGATFLILDALLPSLVEEPNPDRFNDYAWYIGRIERTLRELTTDKKLPSEVWDARVRQEISLGDENLRDVEIKWTWIRERMLGFGWKPRAPAA